MNIVQLLSSLIPGRRKRREKEIAQRHGFTCPVCYPDRMHIELSRRSTGVLECKACRSIFDVGYIYQSGMFVPKILRREKPWT